MGFIKDAWDGVTGKSAAKAATQAGQVQADSAKYAADMANSQYQQTRQDMQPWQQAGQRALGSLENFVYGGAPTTMRPNLGSAPAPNVNQGLPQQTMPSAQTGTSMTPTQNMPFDASKFIGRNENSPFMKKDGLAAIFEKVKNGTLGNQQTMPNAQNTPVQNTVNLAPVMETPQQQGAPIQFGDAMGQNMQHQYNSGAYTNGLDAQSFYQDPSYQWRKQQGLDNIQAQAAAGGGLLSGATLKALNDYNSNLASQEYGNAWQRNMAENQNRFNVDSNLRSQDYNIFAGERSRQYNELANLANVGQTTATNLASLSANNAANMGEMAMAGANAKANGLTTGAYAKSQGMGNLLGLGAKIFGLF